jgi:hypothetical protein
MNLFYLHISTKNAKIAGFSTIIVERKVKNSVRYGVFIIEPLSLFRP